MVKNYTPEKGDIVFVDFDPTKGHEQKGRRPAVVLSTEVFNNLTKMAILCPISNNVKDFPSHYILKDTKKINGAVFCEHIRAIDYESRNLLFLEKCSKTTIDNIQNLIKDFFNQ